MIPENSDLQRKTFTLCSYFQVLTPHVCAKSESGSSSGFIIFYTLSPYLILNAAVKFKMAVLPRWLESWTSGCSPEKKSPFIWKKKKNFLKRKIQSWVASQPGEERGQKARWLDGERNGGWEKMAGFRSQKPQVGKTSLCLWRRVGGQGMTQSMHVCLCVRHCQSRLKHICRSRRKTGLRMKIHILQNHLVTASTGKTAKPKLSAWSKTLLCNWVGWIV